MAEADLEASEIQFYHGKQRGSSYQIAIFHCHQAIEKMLKAMLAEQDKEIPRIHNLVRLVALAGIQIPGNIKRDIEDINPHYLLPRYPDLGFKPSFSFSYKKMAVAKIISMTKEIVIWLKKELRHNKLQSE